MLAPTNMLNRSQAATPLFTPPPLIPWPKKYLSPKWWRRPSSWPLLFTPPAGPSPADTAVVNLRIYPQKKVLAAIQERRHRPRHTAGPSPAEAAPAAAVASNTDEKSPVIQHRARSPRTSRAPLQTTTNTQPSLFLTSCSPNTTYTSDTLHRPQISSRKQTRRRCSNGRDKRHKKRGTKRTKPKRKKNSLKPDVERRRARP